VSDSIGHGSTEAKAGESIRGMRQRIYTVNEDEKQTKAMVRIQIQKFIPGIAVKKRTDLKAIHHIAPWTHLCNIDRISIVVRSEKK
jgi:hypothetical protein